MDRGNGLVAILDDEREVRDALRMTLELAGYSCHLAEDKATFLNSIGAIRPDIIVTDVKSPGMDGIEFLRRMKQDPDHALIPVIFVTGYPSVGAAKMEAFRLGAFAWISKPIENDDLVDVIRLSRRKRIFSSVNVNIDHMADYMTARKRGAKKPSDEIASKLPHLKSSGIALTEFTENLAQSDEWSLKSGRWIPSQNFVTFRVQPVVKSVRITLRGRVKEFSAFDELPLSEGRANAYSECNFKEVTQLAAATFYIRRAYELYLRGGRRRKTQQTLQEL